ncbi:protein OPAQUE10 [Sesamum alatum]|uniref:Protein OPAQUE10 n=1 Tax=Sesamum alatum TaxID=300844 RepID=A0AAE1XRC8_9LAMI|nr:protein OPAQUE10 [Sesamum alatum]
MGHLVLRRVAGGTRPYSNVDSFLKICKILGLSGIDLFSPSDVVEKKNVRKVCICIRALSKKARSKQLSVPDFDMVINSVAMPTDMVGVIRKSLESSQCTLSSSSSYSSRKGSQMKLKQKNQFAPSNRDDDSSSEDSDEAESRYMGEIPFSSAGKLDYADGVNSDSENSPESDVKSQCTDEFKHGQRKSALLSKAVRSASPQDCKNDYELDQMSTCGIISKKKLNHGVFHVNNGERRNGTNGTADVSDINFTLENDDSVVGDSSCIDVGESNYISDYLAFSDLMVHASDGSNPGTLDGENNIFDFFLNVDSQGLTSDKRSLQNGSRRKFSEDEEMEVSSTTSMSSVLGRLLNLEFDDQFDEDDSLSTNVYSFESKEHEAENHYKDSFTLSEPPKMEMFATQSDAMPFDLQEAQPEMAPRALSASTKNIHPCRHQSESRDTQTNNLGNDLCLEKESETVRTTMLDSDSDLLKFGNNRISTDFNRHISDLTSESVEESERSSKQLEDVKPFTTQDTPPVVSNVCEAISDDDPYFPVKDMNEAHEDARVADNIQDNITSAAENGSQDKREHSLNIPAESISDGRKDTSSQLPPAKPGRKPLLKTVVKGTAIAGVLFLLLHIGRKSKGNNAEGTKQYAQVSSRQADTKEANYTIWSCDYSPRSAVKLEILLPRMNSTSYNICRTMKYDPVGWLLPLKDFDMD